MIMYLTYFTIMYFFIIAISTLFYKKYNLSYQPFVSIILPVYNEDENIIKTINSIFLSNYPIDKFELIIINDGSTNNVDEYIKNAINKFHLMNISYICLDKNYGKKHALIKGIMIAKGNVIVTIDSDSIISNNAIKNIVKPFKIKSIGAVAGNIGVININDGIIPLMMDIIFCFCFIFLRSSQSVFGKVLCTPGALSAYRKSAIMPLLNKWKNQKFLGEYTMIGEDRALTCLLLKNNWKVVYQSNAIAKTKISSNYVSFCKMIIRWVRGDIRENILLFPHVFKSFKKINLNNIMYQLHYIAFNLGIFVPIFSIPIFICILIFNYSNCISILIYTIVITLIWSIIPAIIYAKLYSFKKSFCAFIYGFFSLFCISWIPLYSLITIKNNKWLTRK